MRRRLAAVLATALVAIPAASALSGCGAGTGQLAVTLSSPDTGNYKASDASTFAAYKPGDQAQFTVRVVNTGPGSVSGVTIHVLLPPGFRYRSTTQIDTPGATRTQPLDAAVNSNTPIFGLWTLAPPGQAGAGVASAVTITFIADAGGQPGTVMVHGFAAGDSSAGQTDAAPYSVQVVAAPHLAGLISVSPTSATKGGTVTYQVRITNDGTGNATDVAVLVTLPPALSFSASVTPFAGNGTRNNGVDPIKNTVLVYYDGFLLPPLSNGGPGYVVIVFKATIAATATPGTFPVDASITDVVGDTVTLHAVAPVTIS